jgi:Spy/CpxP family protein refolding chaperone
MTMSNFAFVKFAVAAVGVLLLSAPPRSALGQSGPPGAGPAPMKAAVSANGKSAKLPDLLDGLTLADDQKAKIARIRGDTNARLAALDNDRKLSPEAADAMRVGYGRLENSRILEVLTPEQQREVRQRIAAYRESKGKPQYPMRRTTTSAQPSRPQ